jgi:hypothetical protein
MRNPTKKPTLPTAVSPSACASHEQLLGRQVHERHRTEGQDAGEDGGRDPAEQHDPEHGAEHGQQSQDDRCGRDDSPRRLTGQGRGQRQADEQVLDGQGDREQHTGPGARPRSAAGRW